MIEAKSNTEDPAPAGSCCLLISYAKGGLLHLLRRYRLSALFCAFAVLVCELVARPYANMGICDDGPYILVAKNLAATGYIVYNGWSEAMLGWQLYLGAAFIKLFGFSFTTVRMSNLFIAMALAFLLQRIMVRAAISERNATIATLAFVLSPLYLVLSVTYMTDITGLFAILLCLYGCLRAVQAASSNAAIGWLCFAVATNAIGGTSRQLAWLGLLVMVPSTLWLLRAQRRIFFAGAAANLAGFVFILVALHWFSLQPYTEHAKAVDTHLSAVHTLWQLIKASIDFPFLLLPLVALFIPEIRRARPRFIALLVIAYLVLTFQPHHAEHYFLLEPTSGDWIGVHGIFETLDLKGVPPLFLHAWAQILFTFISIGGLIGVIASLLHARKTPVATPPPAVLSWKQIGTILAPFSLAYMLLLVSRAVASLVVDRYLLGLLAIAALCLARYYQDRLRPQLPPLSLALISIMAIYGVAMTHNLFSLYRARVALASEIQASGVPDTSVDNGWEYNVNVELQHTNHINFPTIRIPANAFVERPPATDQSCVMRSYSYTVHIVPLYGASFDPSACYGPAPFAPIQYSRWLAASPGTLYAIRFKPPTAP